jgi:hypothetical protein
MGQDGIRIVDGVGNSIEMTDSAMKLTAKVGFTIDASGQSVTIVADTIDLQKG